jgi:hypothetical protein
LQVVSPFQLPAQCSYTRKEEEEEEEEAGGGKTAVTNQEHRKAK